MLALFQFRNRSVFTTWLILLLINCFPFIVQAATVEGMVFLDENQNGNWDVGERAGVNSIIYLMNADGQFTTLSDANGNFWFFALNPGTANIWIDIPVGWKQTTPVKADGGTMAFYPINLTSADQTITVNFGLVPPAGEDIPCVDFNADNSITLCSKDYAMQVTPKLSNNGESPMVVNEIEKDSHYVGENGSADITVTTTSQVRSKLRSSRDDTITVITGKNFTDTGKPGVLEFTPNGEDGYTIVDPESPTTNTTLNADSSYTVSDTEFPGVLMTVYPNGTSTVTDQDFSGMEMSIDESGNRIVTDAEFIGMAGIAHPDGSYTVTDAEYPDLVATVYPDGSYEVTDIKNNLTITIDPAGNYTLIDKDGQCYVNPDIRFSFSKIWNSVKSFMGKVASFVSKVAGFVAKAATFVAKVANIVSKVAAVVSKVAKFLAPFIPFACKLLCTIAAFADGVAKFSKTVADVANRVADIAKKVQDGASKVIIWSKTKKILKGTRSSLPTATTNQDCIQFPLVALQTVAAELTTANTARITWQTLIESGNTGFNIYRAQKDGTGNFTDITQLNLALIPSLNNGLGKNSYTYEDAAIDPNKKYYYWLENVDSDGNAVIHDEQIAQLEQPFLIELKNFVAITVQDSFLLTWETFSEFQSAAFNLWQAQPQHGNCQNYLAYTNITKLTQHPLANQGTSAQGATYAYPIPKVSSRHCYGLEEIDIQGNSIFYVIGSGINGWMKLAH